MSAAKTFVQEIVLGFGFLGGIFTRVGVDPEGLLLGAFQSIINAINPNSGFSLVFWLIPIMLTVIPLVTALAVGGTLGLVAVGLAFFAGFIMLSGGALGTLGAVLLFAAIIVGLIAPSNNSGYRL